MQIYYCNSVFLCYNAAMSQTRSLRIKTRLSCPHCWQEFPTDQLLFISESPDLPPDPKLPSDRLRFLPQRFSLAGAALDPNRNVLDVERIREGFFRTNPYKCKKILPDLRTINFANNVYEIGKRTNNV
jgi:hypothetical protein